MSDSFADLWSSSAPKPQAPKLSSASSNTSSYTSQKSTKPDVFSLLASTSSSSGSNTPRYGSAAAPLNAASAPTSRSITPSMASLSSSGARSTSRGAYTPTPPPASGKDAFGDLFSSSSGMSNGTAKMTLAARLEAEQQARRQSNASPYASSGAGQKSLGQQGAASSSDAWAGLDSLAQGRADATGKSSTAGQAAHDDDWGLADFVGAKVSSASKPSRTTSKPPPAQDDDDWGLADFGSTSRAQPTSVAAPRSQRPSQQAKSTKSLWDLDEFASPSPSQPSSSSADVFRPPSTAQSISRSGTANSQETSSRGSRPVQRQRTPPEVGIASPDDDFDFGGREDRASPEPQPRRGVGRGLLDLDDDGEDAQGQGYGGDSRRRGLLDDDEDERGFHAPEDDNDVLGMLSQPVHAVRARREPEPSRRPTSFSTAANPDRSSTNSPPPHILGQIVEMGFSVGQAKKALAATSTGTDVQAALENLLGGSSNTPTPTPAPPPPAPPRAPRAAPKGHKERERERLERQRLERGSSVLDDAAGVADLTKIHAEKVLSQASEIGLSVFSKASAFWKEGKEKVVKAYEERSAAGAGAGDEFSGGRGGADKAGSWTGGRGGAGRGGARADGRPKWMQEAAGVSDDEHEPEGAGGSFRDATSPGAQQMTFRESNGFQEEGRHVEEPNEHVDEVDLFSDAMPSAVPTRRHSPPSNARQRPPAPPTRLKSRQTASSSSSSAMPTAPTPPSNPVRPRTLLNATPSALATATQQKTAGTTQFKLGQYGVAADAYTQALGALPAGHLLQVPLYTNRALARLKTGEYSAVVGDCSRALGIIVGSGEAGGGASEFDPTAEASLHATPTTWSPAIEPPSITSAAQAKANDGGWAHPQGLGVDLADGYIKALRRRAEAWEGQEKWKDAGKDWEVLAGLSGAWVAGSVRAEAVRGAGRCRRMLDGVSAGTSSVRPSSSTTSKPPSRAPTRPPVRPKPTPATSAAPSDALRALQSTNAQAEAEDTLKHSLKDTVDARLSSWRTGKETNIRALLASLDLVLWEEILKGGVKVNGLGDLITPAQVKKGYVKAIARVHPDKLNTSNSTVEQRMLANGVFGTLNEAWIAFQAGAK